MDPSTKRPTGGPPAARVGPVAAEPADGLVAEDLVAEDLVADAERFATHLARYAGRRVPACGKALQALSFSLTAGYPSLAVPSKAVGVRESQGALAALRRLGAPPGLRLALAREGDRIAVRLRGPIPGVAAGAVLGYVQPKHAPWLSPLLPLGVGIRLTAVTGDPGKGHLHGLNVHFTGVGRALRLHPDDGPGGGR